MIYYKQWSGCGWGRVYVYRVKDTRRSSTNRVGYIATKDAEMKDTKETKHTMLAGCDSWQAARSLVDLLGEETMLVCDDVREAREERDG